ncbi:CPBP family intramembrane glutamic endopeptidase [Rariglobus hedericola]|uniref:CPBP family intramembrane metalloprotease n=1 Tax=Rariglobus hedericola TaxID=2597822 RepID=A0A556QRF7_9BACT|nr:CPBP family intramembrane glutamic endopeptidase [Rariglobus hedericola]TSJ79218.1 CPBP family intramembrane metalloprotease [Rariglobus hedericola]
MNDQPILLILMIAVGLYTFNLWREDCKNAQAGKPSPSALPGATPASAKACIIAALGALVILIAETWGELRLGLSDQQSKITVLFGIYTLIAAFIEELIFRGFIVIENKGRALRWAGVAMASVLFAALHPFLWKWEDGVFAWTFSAKGWFSTAAVFASSLWFYTVRFASFNPHRSLLPCIVAHATKNMGVILIKGAQGFVVGLF